MTFVINAIKQWKEQQNIEFLLLSDSPLFVRKLVEKVGLVLLSIKDYRSTKESFWPGYVGISYENQTIEMVFKKDMTLKDSVFFLVSVGLNVVDCNTFVEPQSPEQVQKIISTCKKEYAEEQEKSKIQDKKAQDSNKKIYYGNDMLDKSKVVINRIIEKIDWLLKDKWAYIPSRDLRIIKDKIEELKKLRMWANYDKIRDLLQELFEMVDSIEDWYFTEAEKTAIPLFEWTEVSNIDLERQISILEKVKQQKQFGWKVEVQRQDYVALWEYLVFLIFLKKDLLNSLKNLSSFLLLFFDYLQTWIMIVIVMVGLYIPINKMFGFQDSMSHLYYSLFSLGLLGLFFYIAIYFIKKEFVKKYLLIQILLFLAVVFVYFLSSSLIKNSFIL